MALLSAAIIIISIVVTCVFLGCSADVVCVNVGCSADV